MLNGLLQSSSFFLGWVEVLFFIIACLTDEAEIFLCVFLHNINV